MTLAYSKELGLQIQKTDVEAQKINSLLLNTFAIIISVFQVEDKLGKTRFLQELFLLANTSIKVILRISFLIVSNVDIQFAEKKLTWRSYIAVKTLATTKRVEPIDKTNFAKIALNEESEPFVVHVAALEALLIKVTIYLS